jgi:hypothetical protein
MKQCAIHRKTAHAESSANAPGANISVMKYGEIGNVAAARPDMTGPPPGNRVVKDVPHVADKAMTVIKISITR